LAHAGKFVYKSGVSSSSDLNAAFLSVPVNRYLKFQLLERSAGACRVTGDISAEYTQEHGVVHGAIVSAIADTSAVWLFHPDLEPGQSMASIEFKVNFLAPAFLDRGPLIAESSLVRRGRRIGVAQSDVRQNGDLIARGLFTYMFFHRGQG